MVMTAPMTLTTAVMTMLSALLRSQYATTEQMSATPMMSVQLAMNMAVRIYLNFSMTYQFWMQVGAWFLRSFTTSPLDFC